MVRVNPSAKREDRMKIGTLYDTARRYLPEISKREFVLFYNQALGKISRELNVAEVTEEFTGSAIPAMPSMATKILSVSYGGEELSRVMKR